MVSQNFKHKISPEILYELLEKICAKENDTYIFNKIAYKKGDFLHLIEPFCDSIVESYYKSKQFYITRKQTFTTFATIVRQICKANDIVYSCKIEYDKSSYSIVYLIRGNPLNPNYV